MLSFKQFKSTKSANFEVLLEEFVEFCAEQLQLEELPVINIIRDGSMKSTFGCYSEGEISLNILNRHPMDVLRTLAHELVHYRQDLHDELHELSGETGSDHENEANSMAGVLMRNFGRANPQLFNQGAILEGLEELYQGSYNGGGWIGPRILRHKTTGQVMKRGDKVTDFRGKVRTINGIQPPQHPSSEGHITVHGEMGRSYAGSFGLHFTHN